MAKARVYELAKELGVGNKEILEQLKKKNVEVKNHMSTVEDNVAEEIRRENAGRNEEPAKAEPAAEKAAASSGRRPHDRFAGACVGSRARRPARRGSPHNYLRQRSYRAALRGSPPCDSGRQSAHL